MLARFLLITLLLGSAASHAFTGSEACAGCHAQEYANWQGSHHDLAMQLPGPDTVLGDFNNASFTYNGITTVFYREDDDFVAQCLDYDVSSFGSTDQEALANLREAVELYLEDVDEPAPAISQVSVGEFAVA